MIKPMIQTIRTFAVMLIAFVAIALATYSGTAFAEIDSDLLAGLEARAIGPATMSGRVAAVAAVESDTNVIYVGAATGGVWKSVNGGLNWESIFDDEDYASIGALAIYQPNPDIIWVGTGEGNVRNSTSIGGGIYKSIDAGRTWQKLGLQGTERINRIALDPTNPDIAYAAAMGTLWGNNTDRGVYKTTDGGKTWAKILYVDDTTGATDVKIDPSNPNKIFAAMWQFNRLPYHFKSGGPGSGLYVSYDGGANWDQQTEEDGLPAGELGRMVVAMSKADPKIVYALVEAEKSALIRSDDGGASWKQVNTETNIAVRPFYYTELTADPEDPNTLYNVASIVTKSIDGGKTFQKIEAINCCSAPNAIHIDVHALWVNSSDPDHLIVGNDGGLGISQDGGDTWRYVENLPLGQFYHINVDNETPYNIYGGLQDNGTFRGPSEVWENGGIRNFHWQEIGFGDGFDARPDPEDAMQGYAMSQGGALFRWNLRTGEQYLIRPQPPEAGTELRFNWNAGLEQDPFDNATIYYGSQFVHKSTDRGHTWTTISGDMTTDNPDWQTYKESGGLTYDVTAAENYTTITTIAASPLEKGVIWVGSDDGRVHVTRDGGATWSSIEGKAKGVAKNSWVPHIEPSPHNAGTAFIVFDDHRRGNMKTYAYRIDNYGSKWSNIGDKTLRGYALSIQQDHIDPNLLFLGTELGLYVSTDAGKGWFKFTEGVPTVSVMDMAIQARENDLVLGTHGRALFVLDDYSALRGLSEADFNAGLKILSVSDGQQYTRGQSPSTRFDGSGSFRAPNEPYGVGVTFMVSGDYPHPDADKERARKIAKRAAAKDKKADEKDGDEDKEKPSPAKVTVEVRDSDGALIRTFKSEVYQGVNRVYWNQRIDGVRGPQVGKPPEDDTLPAGPETLPGDYSITLKLGKGDDLVEVSANAKVMADPRPGISRADQSANLEMQKHLTALSGVSTTAIDRLRAAIKDIDATVAYAKAAQKRDKKAEGDTADADANVEGDPLSALIKDGGDLKKKLEELEKLFWSPPDTKGYVYDDHKVTSKVNIGRFYVGSSKRAPSPAALAYVAEAEELLATRAAEVNALFAGEVSAYRTRAAELSALPLAEQAPLEVPAR